MVLTAGILTLLSVGSNTTQLITTPASGGTGPYTQQWYRSTTTGFTPGSGNILAGQTDLTLNDSVLIPNTTYYYKVVFTDVGASSATITSAQLTVTTIPSTVNINQFAMSPFLGMTDLRVGNTNVTAAQIDVTQSGPLFSGNAVKIVNGPNGIPTVIGAAAATDNIWGFIVYDIKSQNYPIGARCEIAQAGTCMFLYATTAITRGQKVVLDLTSPASVQAATGSNTIVGYAFDQSPGYGSLIRVIISSPSFLTN
jgi:predicted RecA/RadA family phage recombinase